MPTRDPWDHARNVVIGTALGAAIVWARGSDASFGLTFLAAVGGVIAAGLVFWAIKKLRR
jgi:hypothetical protein